MRPFYMIKQKIKREFRELGVLIKSVPSLAFALFVLSVFSMNLLANKSISIPVDWLALDCGIIVSWFAFFTMDILTKHFGPKAATQLTVIAILINLFFCLLLFLGSLIPGVWGESFVDGSETVINGALNKTFGGTWYVVFGSTLAFLVSAIINNTLNFVVGKLFVKNPDSALAFAARAYVSTAIGQFADNLIFALVVSHFFFGWTIVQCLTCAATGMIVELLCEAVFFYPEFMIARRWKSAQVGKEYFELRSGGDTQSERDEKNENMQ